MTKTPFTEFLFFFQFIMAPSGWETDLRNYVFAESLEVNPGGVKHLNMRHVQVGLFVCV